MANQLFLNNEDVEFFPRRDRLIYLLFKINIRIIFYISVKEKTR